MRTHLWFAAHAVYSFELLRGRQTTFTLVENVLLIRARSSKAALVAAIALGKRQQLEDPSLTLDGKPARQKFLGIRKLVTCAADVSDDSSRDGRVREVHSGTEATYLTYRVTGRAALKKLMAGKEAELILEE